MTTQTIDYYATIGDSIQFMERNLAEPITVQHVCEHSFQSQWHFQRIFRYVTGNSVYGYLRDRRLSEAAYTLITKQSKVIDVALEFQYESPESFTRAFKKRFGLSPKAAKKTTELTLTEPIDMRESRYRNQHAQSGIEVEMRVRNVTNFVGRSYYSSMLGGQNRKDLPQFWDDFTTGEVQNQIENVSEANTLMSVFTDFDYDENFTVTIGAPVSSVQSKVALASAQLVPLQIPARKYFTFTVTGHTPDDLMRGWEYIYGTWLPETQQIRGRGFDFDLYDERFVPGPDAKSEIYIPIE